MTITGKHTGAARARDILLGFVCIGFVAATVMATLGFSRAGDAEHHVDRLDKRAAAASSAAAANQAAIAQANNRIKALGGVPVPTPAPVTGPAGPGPSDEQIAQAVTVYCANHGGCIGSPSQAQVLAAVKAYCATGICKGVPGRDGKNATGAQGPPGQQGPGPSDQQIATALAAYCSAHNSCTGPAGKDGTNGTNGADGKDGRGISSIDCSGLGVDQLTIHYSDGTDETVPCNKPAGSPS